jgi:multidrug efflux system membrane fusion protein
MGAPIWTELNHYMPASKLSSLLAFIKQPRWLLIISGILIMGAIIGIRATSSDDGHGGFKKNKAGGSKFENQTPTVAVAISQLADMPVYLNGLGTVTALHTVTVRSRVDGELVKVNFTEGQYVKQGEVLAEIDPRPYQVQLQQAQGQLMRSN